MRRGAWCTGQDQAAIRGGAGGALRAHCDRNLIRMAGGAGFYAPVAIIFEKLSRSAAAFVEAPNGSDTCVMRCGVVAGACLIQCRGRQRILGPVFRGIGPRVGSGRAKQADQVVAA